ncbi:MAG TPA: cytochrome P450 [Herpetosiphonaceae bacterium]
MRPNQALDLTPENEAKLPRDADLPFGAGPHTCMGNHVALLEAQRILAPLVLRITCELVPGQQIAPESLRSAGTRLRPKGGVQVVVRWR